MVSHRAIILPQLGAPGVAAHEVLKRLGFKVMNFIGSSTYTSLSGVVLEMRIAIPAIMKP